MTWRDWWPWARPAPPPPDDQWLEDLERLAAFSDLDNVAVRLEQAIDRAKAQIEEMRRDDP